MAETMERIPVGFNSSDDLSAGNQEAGNHGQSSDPVLDLQAILERGHVSLRTFNIMYTSGKMGTSQVQRPATEYPDVLEQNQGDPRPPLSPIFQSQIVPPVVVKPRQSLFRDPLVSSPKCENHNRCQPMGVGSSHGQPKSALDLTNQTKLFKLQGITGDTTSSGELLTSNQTQTCGSLFRQHNRSVLCEPTGGHQVPDTLESIPSNFFLHRNKLVITSSSPSEGKGEPSCRLSQQNTAKADGVVSERTAIPPNSKKVRHTINRSICNKKKPKTKQVLFVEPSGQPDKGRRFLPQLGEGERLRLPSIPPDPENHQENPGRQDDNTPHSSILAQKAMYYLPEENVSESTLGTPGHQRSSVAGPSGTPGHSESTLDGLDAERSILKRRGFWRAFLRFSKGKQDPLDKPNIPLVLSFLQAGLEMNLSPSTLKVQVSALSSFLNFKLADNTLVKRFITAASRLNPPKKILVPQWDLNLVLAALTVTPFEPIDDISIKMLTIKMAFLLAITTARRVGEIQALSAHPPYTQILDDRVIMRTLPTFLPKVVSEFHKNQEIISPSFCNNPKNQEEATFHTLDVRRCLLKYLDKTKEFRSAENL
ncbi:uncharacterized protein [Dendropsophus ebraccatus]|uniref:uncharacterized protein n=1 Tax=Dendropsophus ebraccatus TaxID=150705 RepID=UPI0038321044